MKKPEVRQQRKQWKKLDEDAYRKIKILLTDTDLTINQVAKVLNRGVGTVHRISQTSSFEEYKESAAEYSRQYKARRRAETALDSDEPEVAEETAVEPVATSQTTPDDMVVEMQRIASALERLADAWERKPEKRQGLFG